MLLAESVKVVTDNHLRNMTHVNLPYTFFFRSIRYNLTEKIIYSLKIKPTTSIQFLFKPEINLYHNYPRFTSISFSIHKIGKFSCTQQMKSNSTSFALKLFFLA